MYDTFKITLRRWPFFLWKCLAYGWMGGHVVHRTSHYWNVLHFFIYISSHCYCESIKGVICTILQCCKSWGTWCMLWCSTSFGMFSKGRYVSLGVSVYQGGCILPPGTLICRKLFVPSTGLDFPFAVPPKGRGGKTANRHSVFKIEMTHSCMYNIHIYFFIFLMEYKILHIHITYYI